MCVCVCVCVCVRLSVCLSVSVCVGMRTRVCVWYDISVAVTFGRVALLALTDRRYSGESSCGCVSTASLSEPHLKMAVRVKGVDSCSCECKHL